MKNIKSIKYQNLPTYTFIALTAIYLIFSIIRIVLYYHLSDFAIYYQGVTDFINLQNPYTHIPGQVIYPPTALMIISPIGIMPYQIVEKLWTIASFLSLIFSILIIQKLLIKRISFKQTLIILGFAIISFPIKFNFGMGQINLLMLSLITLCFYYYHHNKTKISGIILGLAISIKLTPVLLLLFFIRKKQAKIVLNTLSTIIILNLFCFLILPSATYSYWFHIFPNIPTVGNAIYYNQALTGFLSRLNIHNNIATIINYSMLAFLTITSWKLTKNTKNRPHHELLEYSLYLITGLIAGGLAWQHHFVMLILPYTTLYLLCLKPKHHNLINKITLILMLISYLLISWNIKNPIDFNHISTLLLSHVFYGNLIIFIILVKTIKKYRLQKQTI